MSDTAPDPLTAETPETPAVPAVEEQPTPTQARWYRTLCWPTADRNAKPVVYVTPQDTAGQAVEHARGKINARHGEGSAEKWTITVERTTKPKDATHGGDQPAGPVA